MIYAYPQEAVPRGTLVRSTALNRLGVVTDAEVKNQQTYYTCFYFPNTAPGFYYRNLMSQNRDETVHGILAEESEFDLTFYLMIGPINLEEIDIFHMPGELT